MVMTTDSKPKAGLEDTVATSSAICYLDGDRGVLAYCGYDIHDLARHATFEEVCYLLWHRRLPTRGELGDLQSQLIAARTLPDPVLRHAANFLYMLTGERPSGLATRAFDVALILHADHELNASTFAARVAAATLTDIHSTIVAAIGALKGPLHGGANADVMRLLLDIGQDAPPGKAEAVVRAKLARKEKIPGFGHRVYHTEDPRATHLREMSRDLGQRAGEPIWFEMSQRIEALVKAEKKLYANVDFYSASTYHALGIAIDLFTPIFAVSRVSGWTAHVLEQYANNRLIRPRADYIGPEYPQRYQPLDAR